MKPHERYMLAVDSGAGLVYARWIYRTAFTLIGLVAFIAVFPFACIGVFTRAYRQSNN